jgi:hypothetical protein
MDLLVTVIGNVSVDPYFRKRFLDNPVEITDAYGFRLTKGDFEMMKTMFADLTQVEKDTYRQAFDDLGRLLYKNVPCGPPCHHSIYPPPQPPELRKEQEAAKVSEPKKGEKAA